VESRLQVERAKESWYIRDGEDVDQPHGTRPVNHHDPDGDMLAMHQLAARVSQCRRSSRAESQRVTCGTEPEK